MDKGVPAMLKEFRQRYVLLLFLSVILFLAGSLIGGCTYKSGPKTLTAERDKPQTSQLEDARTILESSITKTVDEGRKFWFQGWVASKIQKRKTTSMYNQGTFDRDKGFLVKASVLQQHYTYYRWKERVYVFEYGKWRRAANEEMPFSDPFAGFSGLLKAADKFSRLPDEKVMGRECLVLRTELEGATDPNKLYNLKYKLEKAGVFTSEDEIGRASCRERV